MSDQKLEAAFKAGREAHAPGHKEPMFRWLNYNDWLNRMETYMEYGKVKTRKERGT